MCKRGSCPLTSICEERVSIPRYFSDVLRKEATERAAIIASELEASEETDETDLLVALKGMRAAQLMMRDALVPLELDIDIVHEHIAQTQEAIACKGAIVQRQHGFFGRIIAQECGSEARKERLGEHLERLEPPEAFTLIDRTDEI